MKSFDSADSTSPSTSICEFVRMKIIGGEFKPGDRLFEDVIGEEFGVSRVPVREAFRVLEGQGFLQSRRFVGTLVTDPSPEEIDDFFRIRCVLEPLAASQAAERRTTQQLNEITSLNRAARLALKEKRIGDVASINSQFHELVALAANNTGLLEMIRQVRFRTDRFNHIETKTRATNTIREHVEIAKAIETGDMKLAEHLSASHAASEVTAYREKWELDDEAEH